MSHHGTKDRRTFASTLFSTAPARTTPEERIGERIRPQPNGCWLFENDDSHRYGESMVYGKQVQVHRWVYEILVGPIPPDHHLHHECENLRCVNPSHVRPMSPSEHAQHHNNLAI